MEYITDIINSELSKLALIALVIVPIYLKLGVFKRNGNGHITKEDVKELLANHKDELKTNDFFHIGIDLGEIKEGVKNIEKWAQEHGKADDERFDKVLSAVKAIKRKH